MSSSLTPSPTQYVLDAGVNLLIISAVFPAFLIPIVIALFLFSTSSTRRKPIFLLNVLAVALGLAYGGLAIYYTSRTLSGREVDPHVTTASSCLSFLVPICVQCILLIRVFAVYPPRSLSWAARGGIYGVLVSVLAARIANASINFEKLNIGTRASGNADVAAEIAWKLPYAKVECYASILFLIRLGEGGALRQRCEHLNVSTDSTFSSYASRLRALFWIALSNFVLPVVFNIAQIAIIFHDPDFTHGTYVLFVNIYVEIISVLLATLWCSEPWWEWKALPLQMTRIGEKRDCVEDGGSQSLSSVIFADVTNDTQASQTVG